MYKVFVNGTALTAEVMNDYLMEQAVPTFTDATERNNAIPAPNAGQHCHLLSTKETYKYVSGTGWVQLLSENVSGLTARPTLVCTSTTRPAHAAGRIIYETDTKAVLVSDGTAWLKPNPAPAYAVGQGTVNTNASADFTVTHNLGTVPTAVFVQGRTVGANGGHVFAVSAATTTTFTARAYYNGVANVSVPISIYWRVDA